MNITQGWESDGRQKSSGYNYAADPNSLQKKNGEIKEYEYDLSDNIIKITFGYTQPEIQYYELVPPGKNEVKLLEVSTSFFNSHSKLPLRKWKAHPKDKNTRFVWFKSANGNSATELKNKLEEQGLDVYLSTSEKTGSISVSVNLAK